MNSPPAPAGSAPLPPPRRDLPWRSREFGSASLRASTILLSVLWFSLSPAAAVVLFIFEAWVYMTLRAAAEGTFERVAGTSPLARRLLGLPLIAAGAGLVYGVLLGAYAAVVCAVLYDVDDLSGFVARLWAERGLMIGAAAILFVELVVTFRYAARIHGGYQPPPHSLFLTFMRVIVLMLPAVLLNAVAAPPSVASGILLVAMLLSILYFEGLPEIAKASLQSRKRLP